MSSGAWALASAGGKDAALALHRAREEGLQMRWMLSVFESSSRLVRFHGVPPRLLRAQARALGLQPVFERTRPRRREGFEEAFSRLLARLQAEGARGIVFGNIHLADVRGWYEQRVRAAGLGHHEPLWGAGSEAVVREVVGAGFRATVVSVNLGLGDPGWLGRSLDGGLIERFHAAGIDPCGERGEYHTFVRDGPGFAHAVPFEFEGHAELEGHRFLRFPRRTGG